MKLIVALMLLCVSVLAEQQVVEWSISPNRTGCFAQKLVGNDIKLVGLEWPEFVKKYEYCYVKKWYGWSKVKTAKMDETGWDWPSGRRETTRRWSEAAASIMADSLVSSFIII